MEFEYTAKRSVQSGHTASVLYTVDIDLKQSDRMSERKGPSPLLALDGSQVTVNHRVETVYSFVTELVSSSTTPDIDDMREFLDSIIGGETFTMDDGSGAVDVVLVGDTYGEFRQGVNYFEYSFKVREL